jgi:hypothetical protein
MNDEMDWQKLARSGDMVAAIKRYRLDLAVGLDVAKRHVEDWVANACPIHPEHAAVFHVCDRIEQVLARYRENHSATLSYLIHLLSPDHQITSAENCYVLAVDVDQESTSLAVEVMLPECLRSFARAATLEHLKNGVRMVWTVDPNDHSVTVLTTPDEGRTIYENGTLDGGEVLPGFSCKVADLFA